MSTNQTEQIFAMTYDITYRRRTIVKAPDWQTAMAIAENRPIQLWDEMGTEVLSKDIEIEYCWDWE